ncbi:MAG: ABC transporter ATP-binding protein [Planctomycetota bacterium]
MICCQDVRKSYTLGSGGDRQRVEALRGVTFSIDRPGFFAIMGQSGSGKSTLLHLLAALDRPDTGTLTVGKDEIHALTDREATLFRRDRLGMVFQQFNLIPTLSARENVELPGMLAGRDPSWLRGRSTELLDRLGLGHRAEHRPDALSGGEQQRAAIARALLFSPPVLLADEPTGNLDSESAGKLWSLLAEIAAERETTVLMVTHEPAAAAHCERILVMRDGTIAGEISPRDETEGSSDAAGVAARYQQLLG